LLVVEDGKHSSQYTQHTGHSHCRGITCWPIRLAQWIKPGNKTNRL